VRVDAVALESRDFVGEVEVGGAAEGLLLRVVGHRLEPAVDDFRGDERKLHRGDHRVDTHHRDVTRDEVDVRRVVLVSLAENVVELHAR
jgi:hypothetical protein